MRGHRSFLFAKDRDMSESPNKSSGSEPFLRSLWTPADAATTPLADAVGTARFTIERLHAQGGLGQVSLAIDGQFKRRVALKEIRPDHRTDDARRRFLDEAAITGQLEHPGVVPIYALEKDATGEPYYAMRFIQGRPLSEAIKEYHQAPTVLAFRDLLQRFVSVCQTMAYAHSKGVIHRDLKPANVMLGDYGETLIVDWGLAKRVVSGQLSVVSGEAVDSPRRETKVSAAAAGLPDTEVSPSDATQPGQALGTPAYMPPEQARGQWGRVGPASDIFSLGAVLYEVLTNHQPIRGGGMAEVLENARAGQFPLPREVQRDVPRALGAICLKAMALKPEERYRTAKELAADVEHWLADEPVSAYAEPLFVRAARWSRKHKAVVGTAAAALVTATIGLAIGLFFINAEKNRTELARQAETAATEQALRRLTQLSQNNAILSGIFTDLDLRQIEKEGKNLQLVLGERLQQAARQLQGEAVGDPLVVADLQNSLGISLLHFGRHAEAIPLLEEALATRRRDLGPDNPDTLYNMNILARCYQAAGRLDLALPLLEESFKLSKAKLGADHIETLRSMNNLGVAHRAAGKPDLALPLWEEALKLQKVKLGADHQDTLACRNNLAMAYQEVGNLALALPLLEETLKHMKATLGADHPDTLTAMNNLAECYREAEKLDLALPLLEQTLKLRKAKLGADHTDTFSSMHNLALAYQAAGKVDLALPIHEETVRLIKAKLGPDHPDTLACMAGLAAGYRAAGKLDLALPLLEEILKLEKIKLGNDHPKTLISMNNLAEDYRATGKLDLALPLYEETFKLMKAKLGADHPHTLISMNNLAEGYRDAGKLDLAVPLYEETFKLMKTKLGPDHPHTLISMANLAMGYEAAGRRDLALPLKEETFKLMKAKLGADHPKTLTSMSNLAMSYKAAGKLELAFPLYQQAAESVAQRGFQHEYAGAIVRGLVDCYEKLNQFDQAEAWRRKWLAAVKERAGADSVPYAAELALLGQTQLQHNNWTDAEAVLRECLAIREKQQPDAWNTFNTKSMLGGALAGQQKYADAEPLLLAGYEGMKRREAKIPLPGKVRLREAVERLVNLYDAWGKKDEADKWRKVLEEMKPQEKKE
jgi:eukaryotic-like serine/threonine-protein kinase